MWLCNVSANSCIPLREICISLEASEIALAEKLNIPVGNVNFDICPSLYSQQVTKLTSVQLVFDKATYSSGSALDLV